MRSPTVPGVVAALSFVLGIAAFIAAFIGFPDKTRASAQEPELQPSLVVDAK